MNDTPTLPPTVAMVGPATPVVTLPVARLTPTGPSLSMGLTFDCPNRRSTLSGWGGEPTDVHDWPSQVYTRQ